ncbi:cathepsin L1-like [Scaptodrosophila lebanonensis]|uniref:cathepsin L n=1 Tax=Drosophila lebanonensis TaxID=7225 RepID=A0A6J2T9V5_DROLE|nr:cathepsin L1-like [Scaptodrosophila lebanonensis]
MHTFFYALVLVACVWAELDDELLNAEWKSFKFEHKKSYWDETEELRRLKIFQKNRLIIAEHNARWAAGKETYEMGINKFSDMTSEEFNRNILGYMNVTDPDENILDTITYIPPTHLTIPNEIDWRRSGAVTPVKFQGYHCGSCYAFSVTGALEGQHFRKTGQLVSLSEQNIVDCSRGYGNSGCQSGYSDRAFQYIKDNGGIDTEDSYPYEAKLRTCRFRRNSVGATLYSYVRVLDGSEMYLAYAVATVGPVSVGVDAHTGLQHYKGGIFYNPYCTNNRNHAVLAVGYGSDRYFGDYWLIKNSWGQQWGEEGYFRLVRNRNNHCGIGYGCFYPLV